MKPASDKISSKRNGYQSDDDNIRYKINVDYFNKLAKPQNKTVKKANNTNKDDDEDNIRYKFPTVLSKPVERKPKPKSKIKVNFWSTKQSVSRLHDPDTKKDKSNRRHTVAVTGEDPTATKQKSAVKVRKRVSFLPSPLFSENHIPMVTVPDDLTIQLNEEEANDLGEDLNQAFFNSELESIADRSKNLKRGTRTSMTPTSPKRSKRKHSLEDPATRTTANENELEFFSKYVVQKLRKMETNQRIYSENLINTVLMLGQLRKLNGKSKISET